MSSVAEGPARAVKKTISPEENTQNTFIGWKQDFGLESGVEQEKTEWNVQVTQLFKIIKKEVLQMLERGREVEVTVEGLVGSGLEDVSVGLTRGTTVRPV